MKTKIIILALIVLSYLGGVISFSPRREYLGIIDKDGRHPPIFLIPRKINGAMYMQPIACYSSQQGAFLEELKNSVILSPVDSIENIPTQELDVSEKDIHNLNSKINYFKKNIPFKISISTITNNYQMIRITGRMNYEYNYEYINFQGLIRPLAMFVENTRRLYIFNMIFIALLSLSLIVKFVIDLSVRSKRPSTIEIV